MKRPLPLETRFWSLVDKRGPDECWLWTGHVSGRTSPRGTIWVDGRHVRVPRVSWFLHKGEWPPADLFVCHTCDVPRCVNPAHLWLGTAKDNAVDASKKGRLDWSEARRDARSQLVSGRIAAGDHKLLRGEDNVHAKVTEQIVRELRASTDTNVSLAARYGISTTQVSAIRLRRKWKHVQ